MPETFTMAYRKKETLIRGVYVCLIVGSLLLAINQGSLIISGETPPFWQISMNYLVPFLVSTISSSFARVSCGNAIGSLREENARLKAESSSKPL